MSSAITAAMCTVQAAERDVVFDVAVDVAQVAAGADPDVDVVEPFIDLEVSFDRSMMKRGHTSHICVAFVVHVGTGL